MEDIQLILYIVFVVIALLARAFKSKNKNQPKPTAQKESSNTSKPKPKSFEDLLKEFESTSSEEEYSQKDQEGEYKEYQNEYSSDEKTEEVYQNSVREAKELKTIDELVDLDDDRHTGNFRHFEGYEEPEEDVRNEYQKLLESPEGAKQAIILSEIINRKYK